MRYLFGHVFVVETESLQAPPGQRDVNDDISSRLLSQLQEKQGVEMNAIAKLTQQQVRNDVAGLCPFSVHKVLQKKSRLLIEYMGQGEKPLEAESRADTEP